MADIKHISFERWSRKKCYLRIDGLWKLAKTQRDKRKAYKEEKIRTIAREEAWANGLVPEC